MVCLSRQKKPREGQLDLLIEAGTEGSWLGFRGNNDPGLYVCGMQLRVEPDQLDFDDTAANGLRAIYCARANWNVQYLTVIMEGDAGPWGPRRMCPENSYVDGAQVRYEERSVFFDDETSLNGLRMHCRDQDTGAGTLVTAHPGNFGEWVRTIHECLNAS